MRRIALINQKGGVGKTTSTANLGAALAVAGQRVVVVDLDPQANLSLHLGVEIAPEEPSTYGVLTGQCTFAEAIRPTSTPGLGLVPSHLDLSGAEMELAGAIGRETILRDAIDDWEASGAGDVDYLLIDCPPSLGLLSVNGLTAGREAFITLQTEFFALQGMSKLVDIVQLLRRRLNPELKITGILPCLYDPRLRLAREVLGEIRRYFPGQVFKAAIRTNVKLAEAPSFGQTIFEYAPESNGARDYADVAREILRQTDGELAGDEPAQGSAPTAAPTEPEAIEPAADGDRAPAAPMEAPELPEAPIETGPEGSEAPPEPADAPARGPDDAPAAPEPSPQEFPVDAKSADEAPETLPEAEITPAPRPEPERAPARASEPNAAGPTERSEAPAVATPASRGVGVPEFVLVPGRGLQPVEDPVRPQPPRAADLPPLPEDAFGDARGPREPDGS